MEVSQACCLQAAAAVEEEALPCLAEGEAGEEAEEASREPLSGELRMCATYGDGRRRRQNHRHLPSRLGSLRRGKLA